MRRRDEHGLCHIIRRQIGNTGPFRRRDRIPIPGSTRRPGQPRIRCRLVLLLLVPRSPDIPDFRANGLEFLQKLLLIHNLALCVFDQHQRGVVVRLTGVNLEC